jgi:hypothetical protein
MRDVLGMPTEQVCAAVGVSPMYQRVLLHRALGRPVHGPSPGIAVDDMCQGSVFAEPEIMERK